MSNVEILEFFVFDFSARWWVLPMPGNTLIAVQRKLIAQFRAAVAWILAPADLQVYR